MTDIEQENTSASNPNPQGVKQENWEHALIKRLLFEGVEEQRRSRRWGIFFKSLLFLYLFILLLMNLPEDWSGPGMAPGKHTALVDLQGVIADDAEASAENIIGGLRAAFRDSNTAGVILRINSPGGSPVQAGYVNDEIRRLRAAYPNIPLYAVISDVCASGGYYVAVAADKIYADKASIVGSIGVLMDGFGFVGTLEKLGIERRLFTAGEHKGFLDPFSPMNEEDANYIKTLLSNVHRQFIEVVKKGRGSRLKEGQDLFNGLVWSGEQGVALGLVDGLGNSGYVAREIIGAEDIVDYTPHPTFLDRFAEQVGIAMGNTFFSDFGMRLDNFKIR